MPRPAARPAIGPIHERFGAAAAAGAAPAVAGAAAGAVCAGLAGSASGAARGGTLRCMPAEPPPPRRLASASAGTMPIETAPAINAITSAFFISVPLAGYGHRDSIIRGPNDLSPMSGPHPETQEAWCANAIGRRVHMAALTAA